jgi:hypothetical protein
MMGPRGEGEGEGDVELEGRGVGRVWGKWMRSVDGDYEAG